MDGLDRFSPARFYARQTAWLVGLAALVFVTFEFTDLDLAISDLFYDATRRKFPLRYSPWIEWPFHEFAKYPVIAIGAGALLGFVASFRFERLRARRWHLLFVALCVGLGPFLIGALKHSSFKHCPYDLERYGGYATYTKLLDPPVPGEKPGGCFPGGHASGGFALMSLYFVWFRTQPVRARRMWLAAFVYGNLLGFSRVLQGAHFVSHHLWTAILVWALCLALYELVLRRVDDRAFAAR
ncbi:MAG: phosphatase PAP2 family protein [Planctomycetes bacterium]|nr:phosphatase PAP2 family protein [Planctomycetota bacterium]